VASGDERRRSDRLVTEGRARRSKACALVRRSWG
jgi:hypothetical protein